MAHTDPAPELVDRFKLAFRDHPLAVTLITAETAEGPVGLTASSVSSVAIDPPAVSFSVTRATGTAGALLRADNLQIHFLAPEHVETARQFSFTGGERFTEAQGWSHDDAGALQLAGSRGRLTGTIRDTVSVGGSVLVVAEIDGVEPGSAAQPLIYSARTFHAFDADHAAL